MSSKTPIAPGLLVNYKPELLKQGHCLHCATSRYPYAVVVSVAPFILCSEEGDMLWTATIKAEDFAVVGEAPRGALIAAMDRMFRESHHARPKK